eukprot:TRINITY_DN10210_c0_g1_i1.p1 TRINITY_DN10210_c0_g1~~TRINITY_DN10210_c0_g1_i1.p1  ORF type:complete len:115 (-),score=20.37 TRINITY_DN10210_c0_g1_i1:661-1005(-)
MLVNQNPILDFLKRNQNRNVHIKIQITLPKNDSKPNVHQSSKKVNGRQLGCDAGCETEEGGRAGCAPMLQVAPVDLRFFFPSLNGRSPVMESCAAARERGDLSGEARERRDLQR